MIFGKRLEGKKPTGLGRGPAGLGGRGRRVRRRLNPEPRVTYVIDRNINYTNICVSGCRFCAFYRAPGAPEGYVLAWENWPPSSRSSRTTAAAGSSSRAACIPTWGRTITRSSSASLATGLAVHGFSPPEVVYWADSGADHRGSHRLLIDAGLSSIPGGGAEILVDRCGRKSPPGSATAPGGWRSWARPTDLGLRTSATMMFGHMETREERSSTC